MPPVAPHPSALSPGPARAPHLGPLQEKPLEPATGSAGGAAHQGAEGGPRLPFRAGEFIGARYQLLRVIDSGGGDVQRGSAVYEALHLATQQPVAIKALYDQTGVTEHDRRMLLDVKALGKLRHQNLIRVFDGGIVGSEILWFSMELLNGCSLRQWIQERGLRQRGVPGASSGWGSGGRTALPVPQWVQGLELGLQVARGVKVAHDAGVVHRDLKPENVFVVEDAKAGEELRVLDFGTARFRRSDHGLNNPLRILSTYAYMPPERLQFNITDRRGDIFALGHILYELLTGRHCLSQGPDPLNFAPTFELAIQQLTLPPVSPRIYAPEIPEPLAALVLQLLSKSPEQRPRSVAAVIEAAEGLIRRWGPAPGTERPRIGLPSREVESFIQPSSPSKVLGVGAGNPLPPKLARAPVEASLDRHQHIWSSHIPYEQPWTDPITDRGEPLFEDVHRYHWTSAQILAPRMARRPAPMAPIARFIAGALRLARRFGEPDPVESALLNLLAREQSDGSVLATAELALVGLLGNATSETLNEDLARVRGDLMRAGHPHALRPRMMGALCLRSYGEQQRGRFPALFLVDGLESLRVARGAALVLPETHRDHQIFPALDALDLLIRDDRALVELSLMNLCLLSAEDQAALRGDLLGLLLGPTPNNTARSLLGEWIVRCTRASQAAGPGRGNNRGPEA